jgi:hypothetical protein
VKLIPVGGKSMGTLSEKKPEMRLRPRKSIGFMPVNYYGNNRFYIEKIKNLSETGVAIETNKPLFSGETVTMTFMEDYEKGPVKINGKVVRSWLSGFAIRFSEVTDRQALLIHSFMDQY